MEITTCILAKNAANYIDLPIKSAKLFSSEVIVAIDSLSDDDTTAKVAASDVIYYSYDFIHFGDARDKLIDSAHGNWIFMLDADEDLTAQDCSNMKKAAGCCPECDSFLFPRYQWLDWERTKYDQPYPDYQLRLFKRLPHIKYGNQPVHEAPKGVNRTSVIPFNIHLNHYNRVFRQWIDWHNTAMFYNILSEKYKDEK